MMMSVLLTSPLSTFAYFLLMSAIASLWIAPDHSIWMILAAVASLIALLAQRLTLTGLVAMAALGTACFVFYRLKPSPLVKSLVGIFILLFAVAMGSHKTPGFQNWLVLADFSLSPDSLPIRLYLNFDKPLIGLFITGLGLTRIKTLSDWRLLFQEILPIILTTTAVLLGLSLATGYVKIDLKWLEFSGLWLLVNLLFTCVAEEALFRGFLQNQLTQLLQTWKSGWIFAWFIASILFGLAHLSGGWGYVCLATVAGLFYGYAFLKTKKIEASICVHFAVNAIHFLVFSYPALKGLIK